jgi:hypothetical protein
MGGPCPATPPSTDRTGEVLIALGKISRQPLRRPRGDREFDSKAKLSRRELGTSNLNHIDAEIDGVSMPDPGILLADEVGRLAAVRRYDILDTPPDGSSDRCSRVGAA